MVLSRLSLGLELWRWRRAGRTARLWWRDDDAREPSPALLRLLAVSAHRGVPLTLAVIPAGRWSLLGSTIAHHPQVSLIQHGVDHRNRREGVAAGEFPGQWSRSQVTARLLEGWSRLAEIPGAVRAFAPPWNDVHPELSASLAAAGYMAWTGWGALAAEGEPPRIDAHLDLLRWRGGPRFRGAARFEKALARELRRRRRSGQWDAPIGLLTHHLDHDEPAWAFLDRWLSQTSAEPALCWTSLPALIGERAPIRTAIPA